MGQTLPPQHHFPHKLYRLLKDLSSNEDDPAPSSASIAWLSHGRAFKIHDQADFICNVVPKYFKQTKLRSFIRQLHLWGFTRIMYGPDEGAWHHPNFLRDEPSQLLYVVRTPVKKKKSTDASYLHATPNYYGMPVIAVESMPGVTTVGSAAAIRSTPTVQFKSSGNNEAPAVFSEEEGLKEERAISKSNLTGVVSHQVPAAYAPNFTPQPYAMACNRPPALTFPFAATSVAMQRISSWSGTISGVMSHAPTSTLQQRQFNEYMINQELLANHFFANPQLLSSYSNIDSLQREAIATTSCENERRASCPDLSDIAPPELEKKTSELDVHANRGNSNQDFDAQKHIHSSASPSPDRDKSSGSMKFNLLRTDASVPTMKDTESMQIDMNESNAFTASGGKAVDNHDSFNSNKLSFCSNAFTASGGQIVDNHDSFNSNQLSCCSDSMTDDEFVQFINEVLPNLNDNQFA